MSQIPVIDAEGKKVNSVDVADSFLKSKVSPQVVQDTVVALRSAQRRGTANTKTKAEVNFSGAKPWKQKGTGRARSGERSSPIWRKGSVAHGPRPHSFRKTVNKKVKQAALHLALADKLSQNRVVLVDKIFVEQPKTKILAGLLGAWKVDGSAMIVLERGNRNVELAARNIPGVQTHAAKEVTTYEILKYKQLVTTPEGLDMLKARAMAGGKAQ